MQMLSILLILVPTAVMAAVFVWKPRKVAQSVTPSEPGSPLLDLGGIALSEVLRRIDESISGLEQVPESDDATELSNNIVVMARSAVVAYIQSSKWNESRGLGIDPLLSKSLSENLLDAMKLMAIGSPAWLEMKLELDRFYSFLIPSGVQLVRSEPAVVSWSVGG